MNVKQLLQFVTNQILWDGTNGKDSMSNFIATLANVPDCILGVTNSTHSSIPLRTKLCLVRRKQQAFEHYHGLPLFPQPLYE